MARIESLAPEQEAMLAQVRDEWLAIGLSTEPADRPAAEAGVRLAYERSGLPAPQTMIWLRSPMEGAIAAAMLGGEQVLDQVLDQVWDQVRGQVWGQVWDQVWGQVWGQVWDQVWDQVRGQVADQVADQVLDQVWGQVRDQVADQVWGQVWDQVRGQVADQVADQVLDQVWGQVRDQVADQVRGQVWGQVWGQVRGQVRDQVWGVIWGQHDAAWLAWVDTWQRLGVIDGRADGLMAVARNTGWWWACRDATILTERPLSLHRDDRNRLHCETGPAIVWPDGWGVWAWHGVRVPRDVIETPADAITGERIASERNVEVRRVLTERIGRERAMAALGAAVVHRDDWGTLWRAERPDDTPLVMVEVVNSTPEPDGSSHRYWLRVPGTDSQPPRRCVSCGADIAVIPSRARQAIAWGLRSCERCYAPAVQS